MENEAQDPNHNAALINSFCEITSSSKEEATFFLESHNWDLDAAVSTFLDDGAAVVEPPIAAPVLPDTTPHSPSPSQSPSRSYSPSLSRSPSRSRSTSPARAARAPYELRSRGGAGKKKVDRASGSRARGVRTLADLNRSTNDDSGTDSDELQEFYTGGEKSGMLVQDPTRKHDVESIFDQARRSGAAERHADTPLPSSSSRSFTGTARLLTGETVPSIEQPPEVVNHTITFWQNGFTIDDGPLRRLDDPENASFLESIKNSQCPDELVPTDRRTAVHVDLVRREEPYKEPKKRTTPFRGTARTLGSIEAPAILASAPTPVAAAAAAAAAAAQPSPVRGLVVDESQPSTSIQLRLSDGTRMISRFNYNHTIGDIRSFIDASRPGGARNYQLQAMGFPPKQLSELEQTIEEAGIANSVVMQKF